MRAAGEGPVADRLRGMIVVLWRSGLRVSEALALSESDLDPGRGAILVRRGKGGKRREVGMDAWGLSLIHIYEEAPRAVVRSTPILPRVAALIAPSSQPSPILRPVSYTHLDVYKRQSHA